MLKKERVTWRKKKNKKKAKCVDDIAICNISRQNQKAALPGHLDYYSIHVNEQHSRVP